MISFFYMNYNRIHKKIQMIVNSFRILAVVILFAVMLVHDIPFKKCIKMHLCNFIWLYYVY